MNKKILLPITLCLGICFASAQNNEKPVELTENDRIFGLSKLWMEVKTNFVYYDQLTFDWDSLYAASIPKVMSMEDRWEYINYLRKMAVMLNDGHTDVFFSGNQSDNDIIRPAPLKAKVYGKKIYVNKIMSNSLIEKGIDKGMEIVKINGQDTYEYAIENVMPYIASSTSQWKIYDTFNTFQLTKGRTGDKMVLQIKDFNGKVFDFEVDKKVQWDNNTETYEFKILPQNIGYLKINTFNDWESIKKFDALYDDIFKSDALIIDLRDNTGGNSLFSNYVLRHLSTEPIKNNQWSSRMYIPTHASWGTENEWYKQGSVNMYPVDKEIYTKPVCVLINNGTFSSAEDFCSIFKGMNRGKLIGTITGGSTGNPIYLDLLENVVSTVICTRKILSPTGDTFVGIGIQPDIEIEETENDFLADIDIVLEKAVAILK